AAYPAGREAAETASSTAKGRPGSRASASGADDLDGASRSEAVPRQSRDDRGAASAAADGRHHAGAPRQAKSRPEPHRTNPQHRSPIGASGLQRRRRGILPPLERRRREALAVVQPPGAYFYSRALGPHPQRVLTLMPHLGFTCPRFGMAAGAVA